MAAIENIAMRFWFFLLLKLKILAKQSIATTIFVINNGVKDSFKVPDPGFPTTSSYKPIVWISVSVALFILVTSGKKSIETKTKVANKSQMVCILCIMN